jgi:hypothetical protein
MQETMATSQKKVTTVEHVTIVRNHMDSCKLGTHNNHRNKCNHRNPTNLGKETRHIKVVVNVHGSLCKASVCLVRF